MRLYPVSDLSIRFLVAILYEKVGSVVVLCSLVQVLVGVIKTSVFLTTHQYKTATTQNPEILN